MDALFVTFPVALAIGLAWLMLAKWREPDDGGSDNPYFSEDGESTDGDEDGQR